VSEASPPRFLDALRELRDSLQALGGPWMVIGGVAVIARGVPRLTVDIDATVWAPTTKPEVALERCAQHGIAPRIDGALEFARKYQVLLLRHDASGVPLDVSLAWLPFEEEALRSSELCDYAGVQIRVPRVEDLIVYKLVAAPPRDLDDVERLLVLYGGHLDIGRVRQIVAEFAEALDDTRRTEALERLLRDTGIDR
jgi:hypothetical protein